MCALISCRLAQEVIYIWHRAQLSQYSAAHPLREMVSHFGHSVKMKPLAKSSMAIAANDASSDGERRFRTRVFPPGSNSIDVLTGPANDSRKYIASFTLRRSAVLAGSK